MPDYTIKLVGGGAGNGRVFQGIVCLFQQVPVIGRGGIRYHSYAFADLDEATQTAVYRYVGSSKSGRPRRRKKA